MTNSKNGILLYRGTRDGFTAKAFHEKCDGKANTVTIIKTDGNYVFGGYTSAKWHSDDKYINDPNAFIFSLRRNGISISQKFMITQPQTAIAGTSFHGPYFGGSNKKGGDILIYDGSDINTGSFTKLCTSYECPSGFSVNDDLKYLAGSFDKWLTTEIEVYQILKTLQGEQNSVMKDVNFALNINPIWLTVA
jgi:hypothetical protein